MFKARQRQHRVKDKRRISSSSFEKFSCQVHNMKQSFEKGLGGQMFSTG